MISKQEAIDILKIYRKGLMDSPSNLLNKDIESFDMAIGALEHNDYDLKNIANTIKKLGNVPDPRYAGWYGVTQSEIKYLEQFIKEYSDG